MIREILYTDKADAKRNLYTEKAKAKRNFIYRYGRDYTKPRLRVFFYTDKTEAKRNSVYRQSLG